jgi:4-hydroxy-tetrahydrodipicolinate reductase
MSIRIALFGFGHVGRRLATILARRAGVEIVAVVSRSRGGQPAHQHVPDLPAHLMIHADAERVLRESRPQVVLHATTPRLPEVLDQLLLAVRTGSHVISSCEELAYPWIVHRAEAETLDQEARRAGVSVLGTGVNPGFVFDALVLDALGSRWAPTAITVSRVSDASAFGDAVRRRLGLGLPPADFDEIAASGSAAAGHVGFRESMDLVAAALGVQLENFVESLKPIVADRDDAGVAAGTTAGFFQLAEGECRGGLRFEFRLSLHLRPASIGLEVIDSVAITDRDRVHEIQVRPASVGLDSAAAQIANAIPHIVTGEPGLRTLLDMRGPVPWVTFPEAVGWRRAATPVAGPRGLL